MKKFHKIMSVFTKTINELEELEASNLSKAEVVRDKACILEEKVAVKIGKMNDKCDQLKEEASAAYNTMVKLKELIS